MLQGYKSLQIDRNKIEKIEQLSTRLKKISAWALIPVSGLLPPKDFFLMLINKCYPITASIRKKSELDFSEQPDIFHDIIGHLPLLTNEKFIQYITALSTIATKYIKNKRATEFLAKLYWYTCEMGLIKENGKIRPYGAAILTSSMEFNNISNKSVAIFHLDIDHIFNTEYDISNLQDKYFYINSLYELFLSIEKVEDELLKLL